jgi:hypothetical protein
MLTFGKVIRKSREGRWTLKELAAQILKEDGQPISLAYLNDIEHDRRQPSSDHLIKQFANALELPVEFLYFYARKLPTDVYGQQDNIDKSHVKNVVEAFNAFRKVRSKDLAA